MRRRNHHLEPSLFVSGVHVVSLTVCTAQRTRWLAEPRVAEIVTAELTNLHHDDSRILAYCVLPDHLHVVALLAGTTPGSLVRLLKGRSGRSARLTADSAGFWQRGYWDHVVRRSEGILPTIEYVFLNPVRLGLAEEWWTYPWLGSPEFGEVGPSFFSGCPAEDVLWHDVIGKPLPAGSAG